ARLPERSRCRETTGNSTHRATSQNLPLHTNLACFAKLAAGRHIILKEGLTPRAGTAAQTWLAAPSIARNRAEIRWRMAYSEVIRRQPLDVPHNAPFMTFFSTAQEIARGSRDRPGGHMLPIMLGCAVTASAIALVA